MPDRLSDLLHDDDDDQPTSLPGPEAVRLRGLAIRRRRQAAATTGALGVLVAAAFAGATLAGGGTATLEPPPAGPATSVPDASPPPAASPAPVPSPLASPQPAPSPAASPQDEVGTSDFGYLSGFGEQDGRTTLLFDRATLLTGAEAEAEAVRRGLEVPVPNDYLITNDNPMLREYVISDDVEITLSTAYSGAEPSDPVTSTLDELRTLFDELPYSGDVPFDITLDDSGVVSITEMYVP